MVTEIKSNKLSPSTSTALQLGDASDTVTIPTGATFTVTDGLGVAAGGTGLSSFTAGDILYASGSTTLTKLGKGTGLQGLQTNSGATAPEWANSPQSLLTAAGDFLYASGANTLAKLAKGSDGDYLKLAGGIPAWDALPDLSGTMTVQRAELTSNTTSLNETAGGREVFSITLPSRAGGKFFATASFVVNDADGCELWFKDGTTNKSHIGTTGASGAPHGYSLSLTGSLSGQALKVYAMHGDSDGATTIYGDLSQRAGRTHLEVLEVSPA